MSEDWINRFEAFLDAKLRDAVTDAFSAYPQKRSVSLDYQELEAFDPGLAADLLTQPDAVV
ncbi:MAG: hypothetical protein Q8P02_01565, partial [Candidatus Micrarchaeota archaeon]|nr:hypothetical protein [Candidatus Micrarchaeota archaeon]